jgi:acetyl esterase/lipase
VRRVLRLASLVLLTGVAPTAAYAAFLAPPKYRNPTVGRAVAYQIPNMHRAKVRRGLIYSQDGGRALRMDVYRPQRAKAGTALPAVLLGGPPRFGKDSGQKVGWAQLIAASGMSAVAFDIRSDNFMATPEAPSTDVQSAIEFVRGHAAALGIDPDRLCTLGFSFGTAPWHLWATLHETQPAIKCNVVYYGPLDLETITIPIEQRNVAEYSAITYLRKRQGLIPPMLVVKAGHDSNKGINDSIDRFTQAAAALSAPLEVVTHPTAAHGFDVGKGDKRTRAIMKRSLLFFRKQLR